MSYLELLDSAYDGSLDVEAVVAKLETLPPAPSKRRHRKTGGRKGNTSNRSRGEVATYRKWLDSSEPLSPEQKEKLSAFIASECNGRELCQTEDELAQWDKEHPAARLLSYSGRGEARGGRLAKREVVPLDASQVWAGRKSNGRIRPPGRIKLVLHPASGFAAHIADDNTMEYATDRGFLVIADYPPALPIGETTPDVTQCGLFTAPPVSPLSPLPRVDSDMITPSKGKLATPRAERYAIYDAQTDRAKRLLPHILRALQAKQLTPNEARNILERDTRPLPTVCPRSIVAGE